MEFKAYVRNSCGQVKQVLIESDWNLKLFEVTIPSDVICVLIESDWNLKYYECNILYILDDVLIESDWNLKVIQE